MSNSSLLERRKAAVAGGVANATPLFIEKAKNAEVWDADGKRYLDFAQGIAVNNTGHAHPKVQAAAKAQIDNFSHTAFQVSMYEPYIELAEKINAIVPIRDAQSVFFSTGAEAVENAVKIARTATGRPGVITFRGAFHGRSALTSTMTGKIAPYRAGAGLGAAAVYHAPFPIPHHGITVADAVAGLHTIFKTDIEPCDVAAIVIEPVQGEGGFYQAPKEFMQELRAICDAHGILMVCDEVQSGFARTGRMFATDYADIEPDLMTIAKAMGSGYPISGVVGKRSILEKVNPGGLGGTYGGNPVACAASLATLEVIEEEKLVERSAQLGAYMLDRLNKIKDRDDVVPIGDVRGVGMMVAFELVKERGGHTPDPDIVPKVVAAALKRGLIILSCGYFANTVRLLAPLTVPTDQLDEALDILEAALQEAAAA
ncbi:4-aminobutyrate--2-oxoglutarate transaminase [Kordiimonas sediminis]|nr:4-aminobutyrate--2-oxoglutarate transaminase [Kordiimonas sediminis]